jgi:hypothetical protein
MGEQAPRWEHRLLSRGRERDTTAILEWVEGEGPDQARSEVLEGDVTELAARMQEEGWEYEGSVSTREGVLESYSLRRQRPR